MLADQQILRIPGPSPIPPSVNRAMAKPMIGHRGESTSEILADIRPKLKRVFGTEQEVLLLTASGTAGLEAAVINTVAPGEEVLVIVTGAFGERFADICKTYNILTHIVETEWGKAAKPADIAEILETHKGIAAVFMTYCETSTGVLNPIRELAAEIRKKSEALVIVDGVSCVGGVETEMDEWELDIVVSGSQKAFMLPAGLAFIGVSERAWSKIETNRQPRFYLDLIKHRDELQKNSTPYTPALSLLFGLQKALELIEEEGLENVYARHLLMMKMTRAAFKELGIPLLTADEDASPTVTAIKPGDFDAEELRKILKQEFAMEVAGGQKILAKKIFRIGHMGYCSPADLLQAIAAIEIGIAMTGKQIRLGSGVGAAQQEYLNGGRHYDGL
ncbi:pyridoxal-phosphate-dependent aminotransferase family protein [Planococcus salinarum]|uniref:pyridoxal-phosphate-dependent aminotransferase family protein n=1 Tax=Planococcus salinarum TaxID=622695 RepID=UPI000E3D1497|nr:alanine--glyoxylate aminotransferase family protein [Planococcus salinarum]TAA73566.1 alanine--glyoxylate aminotransferase family protein [Planococcus salinarum]